MVVDLPIDNHCDMIAQIDLEHFSKFTVNNNNRTYFWKITPSGIGNATTFSFMTLQKCSIF